MRSLVPSLLTLLILTGCAGTGTTTHVQPRGFDLGPSILSGMDPADEQVRWEPGDSILMGVLINDGKRQVVRYVLIQLPPVMIALESTRATIALEGRGKRAYESPLHRIDIELFDENGTAIDHAEGRLATSLAANGFHDAAVAALSWRGPEGEVDIEGMDDAAVDAYVRGVLAMVAILQSIQGNGELESQMKRIIRLPSLLAILTGLRIAVTPFFEDATPVDTIFGPGLRVPVEISASGRTALSCTLDAVPVRRPYHMSAGVVAATATHPTNPNKWARVELLAARRVVPETTRPGRVLTPSSGTRSGGASR